jgi:hypothetical protein
MTMLTRSEIEGEVVKALERLVNEYTSAPNFSFALVPSKRLNDGGLGMKWNGWHASLHTFASLLPRKKPYTRLIIDVMLVEDTFNKNLQSLRYWAVERLVLIGKHNV